jgi:monofunctional biosynthetic peptidoglycan transglycosylase
VRQLGQTGGGAPTGARAARPASHAIPLGRRKRCPWCERLRQSGGALLFAARAPAKGSGGTSHGAARTAGKRAGWVRLLALLVLAAIGLQLYFLLRVGMAAFIAPESTAFQRSELWRLATGDKPLNWRQQWVPYDRISDNLKRAVMASEDSRFTEHSGVEWEAIEKAWQRNAKVMEAAEKRAEAELPVGNVRIRGGSTITQQLAKNLWLSSERSYPRKGQELLLAKELETLLPKRRILEIYLNNVEWGEGVFGAEAAARHHFKKPASALTPMEAARLAVMLPRPKFFERRPGSAYVQRQSGRIAARMRLVAPP